MSDPGLSEPRRDDLLADSPLAPAFRRWGGVVVVGALAIFLLGGGPANFRAERPDPLDGDIGLPVLIAPEGVLDSPPREFRWTPGGDDVDFSQVILYRGNVARIWQSAPLVEPRLEVAPDIYRFVAAGEVVLWRVREVAGGKPRATSALTEFSFEVDIQGRTADEAVISDLLRQ